MKAKTAKSTTTKPKLSKRQPKLSLLTQIAKHQKANQAACLEANKPTPKPRAADTFTIT